MTHPRIMPKPADVEPVNRERGEVALPVKDANGNVVQTYVLRMSTNALVRLEDATGEHITKLAPRFINPSLKDLRAMVFSAIGERHPEISLQAAGDLIDRVGYEEAGNAVAEAFTLAFPAKKAGQPVEDGEGKVQRRGTGARSSSTRRKPGSAPTSSGA